MALPTRDALTFPDSQRQPIVPYLPSSSPSSSKPFVTLTFATSLDSNLSLSPGVQTALSGPESKAMTHYLRSEHQSILVGVGTAIADNPSLNCRLEGVGGYGGEGLSGQPAPIVVDPRARWDVQRSKCMKLAREKRGRAPWLVTSTPVPHETAHTLETLNGGFLHLGESPIDWRVLLRHLGMQGFRSVMIEGGGTVINDLLSPQYFDLVDSVIVTIAPTWLGKGGVQICPHQRTENGVRLPVGRLKDVKWVPLGEDVVLCGRPER
ncbi:5-amino-6-uracil reductase-like protein [Lophiostoma macrostomum CBS 122681]|uniref:2,5-diamino-6-ribosylamino-4(3H)-pyrimidinone 5'-phosphate reductase n=1 Tax=Lophiostoma macrostomum CBS 122681 TaxID=1314788 RepID=A0A6A6SIJ8_9PLEO|nr:5-amino-6-uracil reductase-like protein [Lophiostoma macrostomum CBS 122681]